MVLTVDRELPKDDPRVVAFAEFKRDPVTKGVFDDRRTEGALWLAFIAGWHEREEYDK